MKSYAPLTTLAEKVVSTYVQAFITLLLLGGELNVGLAAQLAIAALPAGFTVIANGVNGWAIPSSSWLLDTVLRVVKTFVATFFGLLVAPVVFSMSVSSLKLAAAGAIAAVLAVIKAALAARVGAADTAALLPADLDAATTLPKAA